MRKILIMVLMIISSSIYGQDKISIKNNSVDLSIGGLGLGVSFNYSRVLFIKENYFISASVGVGSVPSIGGISIPHSITYNLGKTSSFLELGIGGSYWYGETNSSGYEESTYSYQLVPIIGWRKHFLNNLNFRIFASPLIRVSGEYFYMDSFINPYLGISLGYGF